MGHLKIDLLHSMKFGRDPVFFRLSSPETIEWPYFFVIDITNDFLINSLLASLGLRRSGIL